MIHWINIPLFLILVQTLVLVETVFITGVCIHHTDNNRSVQLDCSRGYISSVTVKSGTGSCDKTERGKCLGMTPTLMVDYMNCYWRHECKINWPHDLIIFTESVGTDCIGRNPTFMTISYKCFNPTDFQEDYGYSRTSESGMQPETLLIDACSNLENTQSCYKQSGLANYGGIIRSHRLYPWDYSNKPRNCTVKLYWPKEQQLIVTVNNIDISDDDSLIIENETITASSNKTFKFSHSDGFETSFLFNVGIESNSGKGFLLCFKFVPKNDMRVQDACEKIMGDGNVKAVQEGVGRHQQNISLTEIASATFKPEPSTPKPDTTTEAIPKRCLKKKAGKKRDRCIRKQKNKKNRPKKKRGKRKKNRKDKKPKRNGRRRRHGIRKHRRARGW